MVAPPTTSRRAGLAGLFAAALLVPPPAETEAAPTGARAQRRRAVRFEPFLGTLEEAKRSAAERNVPLLLHVVLEDEPQNDEYRDHILPDESLIEASVRAVVIVSNNGEHELETVKEEVEDRIVERQVCSAYPWFESCEQHRATWDPIYFEFHDPDGGMRCPQTILLDPKGAIAWRFNEANPPPVGEILSALVKAGKAAGPGLSQAELAQAKHALAQGRLAEADSDWPRAWRAWKEVTDRASAGPLVEEAAAGTERALAGMRAALAAVVARLVPGTAGPAYRELRALAAALADTPLEKDAQAAIRDAERDREIRDEVDAAKLEMEAEELWREALALFEAEDERKAERVVRRLLRKRYAATEVAKLLREKYPEWAAEEAEKGK